MPPNSQWNFAGRLVERLGPRSCLIDAASGHTIESENLPRLIAAYGSALLSAGLNVGDRVLIGCALSPLSTVVYLGAIYAGLVAIPVDERTLLSSAPQLVKASGAKALWSESGFSGKEGEGLAALCLKGELADVTAEIVPPADCAAVRPGGIDGHFRIHRSSALCHGEPWQSDCEY